MATHLFLTGDIQVGKSTILNRYLSSHPELCIGGFRTVWKHERSDYRNSLHIIPAAEPVPLTEENCVGIREGVWPDRKCVDFTDVYDTVGTALLRGAGPFDIYLMDEIGLAENNALRFQAAVLRLLDGDTPVIGVVRDKPGVLPDLVRAHPRVRIITVTVENRNEIMLP